MTTEKRPNRSIKRTVRAILTVFFLFALVIGAYFFIQYRQQQNALAAIKDLDLVAFERKTLISSINGTGTVQPAQDALLVWQTNGHVGSVAVSVGSQVQQGDLLAALDENDLPLDILQARMEKLNAEQALENLESSSALRREQLKADISAAQNNLKALTDELALLQARECSSWRLRNLQTNLEDAQENYRDNPNEFNLRAVQAAQSALDFCAPEVITSQTSSLEAKISLQQETIATWQSDLDKISNGPDPIEREKLELQLAIAEKRLASQQITAPFSGTITSVSAVQGALVSAGTQAFRLADLSTLQLKVPVSEVDIPNVAVGQKALMTFDAYFNQTFTGQVLEISGAGENQAGVINYLVTISIDDGQAELKPGMTAGVVIQIAEKTDVLALPVQAVTNKDGKDIVYVMRADKPVPVEIQVGAYSEDQVEILSGNLEEGEMVVLNPPTSVLDRFPGMFGNR
ncbi:MAG: efflux RND transporter periplasmic adaptor subunit [Anaerolineaceae bacterium]|nr:efflux RND transporter periplasmic adaptor subunit [Anaerolineaceae bacterium]